MDNNELSEEDSKRLQEIREERSLIITKISALQSELKDITNQIEKEYIPVDGEDPVQFRKKIGLQKFQSNPREGIDFLIENHIVQYTPESIAQFFLQENDFICKTALGNYLGEISRPFNMDVLKAFTADQSFHQVDYLTALRSFLSTFNLPGESQKIDKIMDSFAISYHEQNPTFLPSKDAVYFAAYATIILNTALHNEKLKNEQVPNSFTNEDNFVLMMKESNHSYPDDFLRRIFNDIKMKPIRSNEADRTQYGSIIMKGWLMKWAGRLKTWKKRWFVLTDNYLLYYITPQKSQPKGEILLTNANILGVNDPNREFTFSIFHTNDTSFIHVNSSSPRPLLNGTSDHGNQTPVLHPCQTSPGGLNSLNNSQHPLLGGPVSADISGLSNPAIKVNSGSCSNVSNLPQSSVMTPVWRMAACNADERDAWIVEVRKAIQRLSTTPPSAGAGLAHNGSSQYHTNASYRSGSSMPVRSPFRSGSVGMVSLHSKTGDTVD